MVGVAQLWLFPGLLLFPWCLYGSVRKGGGRRRQTNASAPMLFFDVYEYTLGMSNNMSWQCSVTQRRASLCGIHYDSSSPFVDRWFFDFGYEQTEQDKRFFYWIISHYSK